MLFLLGAVFGSFLNVCIYRLPRRESVLWPGSSCPYCKSRIPLWLNLPIVSYLFLRGKCRYCKHPIPITYPLVELMTGVLLALLWRYYGFSSLFLHYAVLTLLLLPITFIDLKHKLILNVLTFPGMAMGIALSLGLGLKSLPQVLLGMILGGGFLLTVAYAGKWIFKQESMGGGDIKLGAMIGVFIGPQVLIALFLAFFLALPVIAVGMSSGRLRLGSAVPFGPFIALATVVIICFGPALYRLYFSLFGYL
jgi:leader peptidase (prepilin peptidase)/N-methyltransferase